MEAQNRKGYTPWRTNRQTRTATTPTVSTTTDNATPKTELAIVPMDQQRQTRPGGL